jgi:hypothetical protein
MGTSALVLIFTELSVFEIIFFFISLVKIFLFFLIISLKLYHLFIINPFFILKLADSPGNN